LADDLGKELRGLYMFSMVLLQQMGSVDVIGGFPSVITLRASLPLDQILQGIAVPEASVITYGFDFVLSFVFY
jgi:hypothetical protein